MGLVWFLTSFFLLATSSFAGRQEAEPGLNHSALHLTLYHVQGYGSPLASQPPPSFSELVSQDQARVKHLNSRLTKNRTSSVTNSTSHKSGNLLGSKFITEPVNPDPMGNYYVKIGLGTPPTYYPVIVDTGSSFSWLQCKRCAGCNQPALPFFDPSASSTYKSLSCTTPECDSLEEATLNDHNCTPSNECKYNASYADHSFSIGYLSQDSLTLTPSETVSGFVYGCGQENESHFFYKSSGLIGLARHKLSMLSQLSARYGYDFSYCLPTASGGSGGSLSIGSDSLMGSSYKFTPMLTNSRDNSLYFLNLSAIAVAGRTLGVAEAEYNKDPTIIDSGTLITRLPTRVYTALRDEFRKIMSSKKHSTVRVPTNDLFDTCYKGSLKEMSDVPVVRMVFQGDAELTLAPRNVLIDVAEKGITCLAFANNLATDYVSIIGSLQQQTFSVSYDVSKSRIGFAAGGCS